MLAEIQQRIAEAARRCGRSPDDILLIGVTKYVDAAAARALFVQGLRDLGESRPQQLWDKAEQLADLDVQWHLIGHLQRNKVRRTLPLRPVLHSLDSERLALTVEQVAEELDQQVAGLLEVNISGDAAKHGVVPEAAGGLLDAIAARCTRLRIIGLMGMASLHGGQEQARRDFERLRLLRDRLARRHAGLRELSMGMSGDFEQAIEQGATMVRIGSALFE